MGLYSKKINFPKLKFLHNLLITFLSNYIDKYYFLGKGELEKAKKISKKNNNMEFLPFCIDTDFWNVASIDLKNNEYVLFVGNDGNRDYEKVFEIAQKMPEKKFIFITKNKLLINSNLVNVDVIDGSWGSSEINDLKLLEIYRRAKLVILPLLNTFQPSGQSVSLQAMSIGVPVMISLTDGFWDIEKFSNNKNIMFVENNSINTWINKINNVYKDPIALQTISKNAKDLVNTNYSLKKLNNFLEKQIG
jgi:glycosyltransferase involved in cell wall biosynthesis